jgi:CDGSH-type Zn-finger protein
MEPSESSDPEPCAAAAAVVIKVRRDGPYKVTGPFVLTDADGNVIPTEGDSIVLCRCGRSGTPPFCDRTHGEPIDRTHHTGPA